MALPGGEARGECALLPQGVIAYASKGVFYKRIDPRKSGGAVPRPGRGAARQGGRQSPLRGEGQPEFPPPRVLAAHGRGGAGHHRGVQHRLRRRHRRRAGQHRIPPQAHRGARLERVLPRGPAGRPGPRCGVAHPPRENLEGEPLGQEHPPLRFHAGAGPL